MNLTAIVNLITIAASLLAIPIGVLVIRDNLRMGRYLDRLERDTNAEASPSSRP